MIFMCCFYNFQFETCKLPPLTLEYECEFGSKSKLERAPYIYNKIKKSENPTMKIKI